MTVDLIYCAWCGEPIHRTARQVATDVRTHKGRCTNSMRGVTWPEEKLQAHMAKMRDAAARTRTARALARLATFAPGVAFDVALSIWERGYQAGHKAKRRKKTTVPRKKDSARGTEKVSNEAV